MSVPGPAAPGEGELTDAPGRGDGTLRVMSFNIRVATVLDLGNHWGFRKGVAAETVRRFSPDVLGTQECLPSQAAELSDRLPGYRMVGVGRSDGDDDGEMCAIFYRADRFRELDAGHFWLSEEPEVAGSRGWGAWFPRMVSWVKLRRTDGGVGSGGAGSGGVGQTFYVFNTHLAVMSGKARSRSAELLRQRAAAITGGLPFVVTGDFNAGEGSAPYRLLVGGASGPEEGRTLVSSEPAPLLDAFREAHPRRHEGIGTRHGFRGGSGGDRIDWILHTRHFQTLYAEIDRYHDGGRYPSDHYPVTAILRMPGSRGAVAESGTGAASE